jgi:site-specific recombinase XerD
VRHEHDYSGYTWHTFRHSFSTILIANGESVKVVQELMRHAGSRCTLEVYSQARIMAKRQAQQRAVQMTDAFIGAIWSNAKRRQAFYVDARPNP